MANRTHCDNGHDLAVAGVYVCRTKTRRYSKRRQCSVVYERTRETCRACKRQLFDAIDRDLKTHRAEERDLIATVRRARRAMSEIKTEFTVGANA